MTRFMPRGMPRHFAQTPESRKYPPVQVHSGRQSYQELEREQLFHPGHQFPCISLVLMQAGT
jgi:hypothetical protein